MSYIDKWNDAAAWQTGGQSSLEIDNDDNRIYVNRTGTRENIDTDNAGELTVASTLKDTQSGATFFINNATGFITTLPLPALGLKYTFINKTANTSGNHTIVTSASANIIKGNANPADGAAGSTSTAADTINFVANASLAGDKVNLFSDGTSWFAYAIPRVATGMTFATAS